MPSESAPSAHLTPEELARFHELVEGAAFAVRKFAAALSTEAPMAVDFRFSEEAESK